MLTGDTIDLILNLYEKNINIVEVSNTIIDLGEYSVIEFGMC